MNGSRIIVVGGLNMDIVIESERMPEPGEFIYGKKLHYIPGGAGLNQAVVAARLGSNSEIVGFIGDDDFGSALSGFLEKEKVDTKNVKRVKGAKSGVVFYIITGGVERHLVFPGSNVEATSKHMPKLSLNSGDIVAAQLTVSQALIEKAFRQAKRAGATTILNLFPDYPVSKELIRLSDYLVMNEVELAYRSGDKDFATFQHKALGMYPETILNRAEEIRTRDDQIIITTLAERGAVGIRGANITKVDGIKVKFADATGAGDCFLGAFATGLSEGMQFHKALMFANCAAAISVQKVGTTSSFPKRDEVDRLLKEQVI